MIHDVAIIQSKYGFDMTTRTGNTTYGFNATADVTNEAMRFKSGEMFTMFTIWDAGGNDTLDLSGYHTPSIIDLRPGSHSSAGGWGAYNPALLDVDPTLAQINANNALAGFGARTERLYQIYFNGDWSDDGGATLVNEGYSWKEITGTGEQYLMEDNIGIAYGALVENAKGGYGDDRINGNQVNNQLTGNGGADTFIFVNDGSVDTIMDFKSGVDRIDLSEVAGLNASKLMFSAAQDKLFVNTDSDAAYEMTIIVKGDDVNILTDIIF
jgi:Ca2+-binding RTX toxin-like protein